MLNSLKHLFPQAENRAARKPVDRAAESAAIEAWLRTKGATQCPVRYAIGASMMTAVTRWDRGMLVPGIGARKGRS